MTEQVTKGYIDRKPKGSGEYEKLFLEGIELLQELSSANWTDYNEHDPGVTILENLVYTLSSLTYKTELPIIDILTASKGRPLDSGDNGFFIPSEILTTNPVTKIDFIKIFIDQVDGVKNAWIKFHHQPESQLVEELHVDNLKGLYHIYIETYNDDINPTPNEEEKLQIKADVTELFHKYRNLCEDLYEVTILDLFELQLHIQATLADNAKGEHVFALIYYKVNNYLANEVTFSSLSKLEKEGKDIDAIFNGPLLNNGFINDNQLRQRKNTIQISEIMKIISEIPGIDSVDEISMDYKNDKGKWVPCNTDNIIVPAVSSAFLPFPESNSNFLFKNDGISFYPNLLNVKKELAFIESMEYGSFRAASQTANIIQLPKGDMPDIKSYYPIRKQFPLIYGIGNHGLPKNLPKLRYAQANQLNAYLLPFDQLMSNFLAQLNNVYTLYDVKKNNLNSYFYEELTGMSELAALIKSNEYEDLDTTMSNWKKTLKVLNNQYDQNAINRLNEVADNLLARFSETFPTYTLNKINNKAYGDKLTTQVFERELLSWKRKLIENYAQLSYDRAKAYDYKQPIEVKDGSIVEQDNHTIVPGIVQKVAILMGIENFEIRSLCDVIKKSGIKIYQRKEGLNIISEKLEIIYADEKDDADVVAVDEIIIVDETVEDLRDAFYYLGNAKGILENVLKDGVIAQHYQIKQTTNKKKNTFYVVYTREDGTSNITHIADSFQEAKKAITYAVEFLTNLSKKSEGIYLVEHLLLSPPYHGNHFGFTFKLPLGNNETLKFEQINLKSNGIRNADVNTIITELPQKEKLEPKAIGIGDHQVIQLFDNTGTALAVSCKKYDTKDAAQTEIKKLNEQLKILQSNTNLSASEKSIEFAEGIKYYAHYGDHKVNETFFSFKMSFILPSWPVRFQNSNFRTKFNNLVYEQAPIHIAFDSFWLDYTEMLLFENTYAEWVQLISNNVRVEEQMEKAYKLITQIQEYHKIYDHKR